MSLAKRVYIAAKTTAAMTYQLSGATGSPGQAARFAALHLARNNAPAPLTWHGLKLAARRIDWPALQEVLIENEYGALAPYLTRKRTPVVLDLGANIGTFALFAFSLAPEAKVYSYEPSATTYATKRCVTATIGGRSKSASEARCGRHNPKSSSRRQTGLPYFVESKRERARSAGQSKTSGRDAAEKRAKSQ